MLNSLRSGQLAAAGLDVFESEPNPNPELVALTQVFATPHMASTTVETRNAMGLQALANVRAVLQGGVALDPL